MAIKLVAIDLDDTLLDNGLRISPNCLEAIRQVQERNILVTLATGRMYRSALPYARQLNVEVPLITYQGALVKNSVSQEVLYHQPVPGEQAIEIMDFFQAMGVHYHCYFGDSLCMEKLTEEGREYALLAGVEPVFVNSLREAALSQETFKILAVIHCEALVLDMEKELKARYQGGMNITRSKPYYLEVMHHLANKGEALRVIAEHYGIERNEVMALGDSYNDLAMLQWAGIGVAMGNAQEPVKQAADYVTRSNEEEGVAQALYQFIL